MENQIDQGFLFPSEISVATSQMQSWPSPCQFSPNYDNSPFSSIPPPPPPSIYGDFYPRRVYNGMQFSYDHGIMGNNPLLDPLGLTGSTSSFGSLQTELISKMSAQEILDAKARAASKSHSEAERRRRERINAHLGRLRSLLPSTTKTDKASLLAEVIQHLKELKQQTSAMAEENPLPTESDELTVVATSNNNGEFIVKASLCCEDRSDLMSDVVKALRSLKLRTLKAEITSLGGRVKNVLIITGDDKLCQDDNRQLSISSIQDVLKAVMDRSSAGDESSIKRQRTSNLTSLLHQRSL